MMKIPALTRLFPAPIYNLFSKLRKKTKQSIYFALLLCVLVGIADLLIAVSTYLTISSLLPANNSLVSGPILVTIPSTSLSFSILPLFLIIIYIFLLLASNIFKIYSTHRFAYIASSVGINLSDIAVTSFTLNSSDTYRNDETTSRLVANTTYIDSIVEVLYSIFVIVSALATIFCIFLGFLLIDIWISFLLICIVSLVYGVISLAVRKRLLQNGKSISELSLSETSSLREILSFYREIRVFNLSKPLINRFLSYTLKRRRVFADSYFVGNIIKPILESLLFASSSTFLFFSLTSRNSIDNNPDFLLRGAIILIFALQKILPSLQQIYSSNAFVKNNLEKFAIVNSLIDQSLFNDPSNSSMNCVVPESFDSFSTISFNSVSYQYSPSNVVFTPFSLCFSRGQKVLLTGKSGSGKSTFCDLLMGFLAPSSGSISIDHFSISNYSDRRIWQSSISFAPQSSSIFQADLCYNVCLTSVEDCDYERFRSVCAVADISDLFKSYEQSPYHTFAENGSDLSGGQKQRIFIARAIYKRAPLYIFDEPTSAVDSNSSVAIISNILNFLSDSSILIVSHDTSIQHLFNHRYCCLHQTMLELNPDSP